MPSAVAIVLNSVDKRGFYLPPRHKDTKNHQEKLLSGQPPRGDKTKVLQHPADADQPLPVRQTYCFNEGGANFNFSIHLLSSA